MPDLHTLYAVDYDSNFIDQIDAYTLSPNIAAMVRSADGQVDPTHVATQGQVPSITLSTSKIVTALAAIGISGMAVAADALISAWFQKMAEGGARAGAASHIKMTVNKGIIVPRRLRADQAGSRLDYEVICTWDGTNAPVIVAGSQSLTGTPEVSQQFVAGPVSVNGTTISLVQEIEIDFGIQLDVVSGDGQVYAQAVSIRSRRPSITVRANDMNILTTLGVAGAAQSATNSVVYLRKVSEGGGRVADATLEHVSFTVDEGAIHPGPMGGSHDSPMTSEVNIVPTYDGTNAILVISTAAAIA